MKMMILKIMISTSKLEKHRRKDCRLRSHEEKGLSFEIARREILLKRD